MGLIYSPNAEFGWNKYGFMTPHAKIFGDTIRIWGGVRDEFGISRIGFIDVKADNPQNIVKIGTKPALDIGNKGCFDDNGMILGDILYHNNQLFMYYVGFQIVKKAKFLAFSGLAISNDFGETFYRYSEAPIMDRTNSGRFGICIHTVLYENNIYKIYYSKINDWKYINNIPYPVYDIWYTESDSPFKLSESNCRRCISCSGDEYRIGRPTVYKTSCGYVMFYTRDLISKEYKMGLAISMDGIHWQRDDINILGSITKSEYGWDSEMICYPYMIKNNNKLYLFYNGNGMGRTGIGYASSDLTDFLNI